MVTMLSIDNSCQQYVLSLDNLDFAFLSQYVERSAKEKRLLWSKPFLDGESVYCEVHIPAEDLDDEDAYIEPSDDYVCHICNIDVPRPYIKLHNKSRQHQSFNKLIEKVLDSVSKQIKLDIDCVDGYERHDKFYCEVCSKVVLLKHKQRHNQSKYHLQSIEDQKLVDNFMEKYIGKDEVKSEITDIKIIPKEIECDSESNTDWNFDSESENETGTDDNQVIQISTNLPKASDTDITQVIQIDAHLPEAPNTLNKNAESSNCSSDPLTTNDTNNFLLYLEEMKAKFKLNFDLPTVEDEYIVIVTPKGYKEKITIDAFHGYTKVLNTTFCQICYCFNIRDEDKDRHSQTEEHVRKIIQPIDDSFIREVSRESGGHCLLCNTIITNSYHTAISPNHKNYIKINSSKGRNTKTFCDVCEIHIDTLNFASHVNGRKHWNKLINKLSQNRRAYTVNKEIRSVIENKEKNHSKLKVAPGGTSNNGVDISHNNTCDQDLDPVSKERGTGLGNLPMLDNKLIHANHNTPSRSEVEPSPNIPPENTVQNVSSEETLYEYIKQMAEYSSEEVMCLVCNFKLPNLDNNIIEHVEHSNHKKGVEIMLNENNVIQKSFKCYYCELCDSNTDNFVYHIKYDFFHNLKYLSRGTVDKTTLIKYVYEDPSYTAILPLAYKVVHQNLLEKNRITSKIHLKYTSFYCNICAVYLPKTTEIDHIFNERHKSLLIK